ncbi:hypothetical protein BB561_002716 [Smittium simulii]|uniref:RRM domain-containing protein n=1 Tax=Smittium simulii TaxID=133385 RepID=A0A2T9YPP8_9FUNG|nr:hypothetical protein BB561_002716 [Smittium simulii]
MSEPDKVEPTLEGITGLPHIPGMPTKLPREPPCTKPNKTLYINNINERIKIENLKQALATIFKTYGDVIEVRANASLERRGQAYVVFKDQEQADKALKEAHGFVLFGKPLMIQYARSDSFATISLEGGDLPKYKEQHKVEKEKRDSVIAISRAEEKANSNTNTVTARKTPAAHPSAYLIPGLPNKILFLQQVPTDAQHEELQRAFQQFPGFVEVRPVPGRADIAFVEYDNESLAAHAKASLGDTWTFRQNCPPVLISFARR